jgi:hypothetical protein
MPPRKRTSSGVNDEHVHRHRAQGDRHIGGQHAQQVPAEQGRQVEHQGRHRDRRDPDHDTQQRHHDLQQAVQGGLQRVHGRALGDHQPDAEEQREDDDGEDLVLRRRLDDVAWDHLQEEVGTADALRRAFDDPGRALAPLRQQRVTGERVHARARLEYVHKRQADRHCNRGDDQSEGQGSPARSAQRRHIAHLGHAGG